ncbi:hypothetical protein FQA39_LY10947 [Lamprigera yunnana]|nr:hypothetical protein FQA39_LY10947 [Lamprigera yunnana]
MEVILVSAIVESPNCFIQNVEVSDWLSFYIMPSTINDTTRGEFATFAVKNISEIVTIDSNSYINATIKDNNLTLFITPNFENFENETTSSTMVFGIEFNCTNNQTKKLSFYQTVVDTNNHQPMLNLGEYNYSFAMEIPKNFELTTLLPINASDLDFTNKKINFTIDENEDFVIKEVRMRADKTYFASLKSLRNIKPPYHREFVLSATDYGTPEVLRTVAPLTVTVQDNTSLSYLNFTSYVYYGNYVENKAVVMDKIIQIKSNHRNIKVNQIGYTNLFNISYDTAKNEITIQNIKPLPSTQLSKPFLVIGIEAEDVGASLKGYTTAIIRTNANGTFICDDDDGVQYSSIYMAVGIAAVGVVVILLLNVIFLGLWYRKRQMDLGRY